MSTFGHHFYHSSLYYSTNCCSGSVPYRTTDLSTSPSTLLYLGIIYSSLVKLAYPNPSRVSRVNVII